ncbi:polysaccharide deacetylase family protein [Pseudonocardia adelaidensis]|uniref:Polysaccharide deacetylase family protein n=1 Tax=Pseudonocardia adelaidensis TaxID=648754 RepID=A0ABP9N6X2_9PSEU
MAFVRASGYDAVGITDALRILSDDSSRRVVALTFDDALLDFLNAFDLLGQFKAGATLYVPTAAVGVRVSRWDRGLSKLSWEQIDQISAAGVEIGSQAMSGRHLDTCSDDALLAEVRESKRELEDRLGKPITSFCYPAGLTSARVRRAVVTGGYSNACTLVPRTARPQDDVFGLPRLRVRPAVTGDRINDLLRTGGKGATLPVERIAVPAWRMARRTAVRVTRVARCMM